MNLCYWRQYCTAFEFSHTGVFEHFLKKAKWRFYWSNRAFTSVLHKKICLSIFKYSSNYNSKHLKPFGAQYQGHGEVWVNKSSLGATSLCMVQPWLLASPGAQSPSGVLSAPGTTKVIESSIIPRSISFEASQPIIQKLIIQCHFSWYFSLKNFFTLLWQKGQN